jgi:sporulation protein YlmC with PRC-barrel domain
MKPRSLLLILTLAAISLGCQARETNAHESQYRPSESFAEFIGIDVLNLENQKLGTVKLITMDLENARLVEVVVRGGGGFLGLGVSRIAVPPRALTLDVAAHVLRLDVTRARFAAAPRFDASHMAPDTQRDRVAAVNRYFGLEPWFFTEGQKVSKNAEILKLGHVETGDEILRLNVTNHQGQYIGHMGTLRMDLPKGQIIHVVVNTDANSESPRRVIQPRALRYNANHDGLVLDNTLSELADEPHFRWLNGSRTLYQEEAYVNRDETRSKMDQGVNYRDREKTSRIQTAIQNERGLSPGSRNIQVVTMNGQTTLTGHVNSAKTKERLGAIAAAAGRPENVSNLLQVRP